MKFYKFSLLAVLTVSLVLGGAGCKRKPKPLTQIPGMAGKTDIAKSSDQLPPIGNGLGNGKTITGPDITGANTGTKTEVIPANTDGTIALGNNAMDINNADQNREIFAKDTVYFDFDRSAVRASERVKVEEVGTYLKGAPNTILLIEGHCDERGTEEYNRALGERRALSLREYLVNYGIPAERIQTISYGEDKPADLGHDDSAWAKNRRGEFILLTPRQ